MFGLFKIIYNGQIYKLEYSCRVVIILIDFFAKNFGYFEYFF